MSALLLVGGCFAHLTSGDRLAASFDALLDAGPSFQEVKQFAAANRVPHSVHGDTLYAKVDMLGFPFEKCKTYRVHAVADGRVTDVNAELVYTGP